MSDALHIDESKLYFGYDIYINDYIKIHTPTIGEIIEYGESDYYSMISSLTAIPSDMKSRLFDLGIDYEEIPDFDFFFLLTRDLTKEQSNILLYDLDLSKYEMYVDPENEKHIMYNPYDETKIDELAYAKIMKCIRTMHYIKPKVEKAANKTTKRILIDLDRQKHKKHQQEEYKSTLIPLVSAMMRYPGFKYKSNELKECTIYEFMDTVRGSQIYIQSTSLIQGSYSGMIDTSKINKKEFDWMRDAER
ncbi:MAG: hypothetical protein J6W64_04205 [Bacilli bacterium]|nr:hypothetical protein [Bacilli bacterium]MBO7518641.1 hypothetical protein [Methanobrevibacter sp.]